jgi:hypothetical protein
VIALVIASLLWTMPPSLEPRREEVELAIAESIALFRDQCAEWRPVKQCNKAVDRAKIKVLDTERFKCGKVLNARGCFIAVNNITVAFNHDDIDRIILHELCHFFGPKVGHVNGKEDCQPVK